MTDIQFAQAKNQHQRIILDSLLSSTPTFNPACQHSPNTASMLPYLPTLVPPAGSSQLDCTTLVSSLVSLFSHMTFPFLSRQYLKISLRNINQIIPLPCLTPKCFLLGRRAPPLQAHLLSLTSSFTLLLPGGPGTSCCSCLICGLFPSSGMQAPREGSLGCLPPVTCLHSRCSRNETDEWRIMTMTLNPGKETGIMF